VLGTAFNVLQDVEHKEIRIDVIRGKVMMYNSAKSMIVEAGMTGVYQQETKTFSLLTMENENLMAYATHALSFSNSNLHEVSEQLSKAYGVQFNFENPKLKECRLTTEYQNKSLPFVMNVIAETLNINYYIKDNTVYISGNGCF
jgi:transmembrane sensor